MCVCVVVLQRCADSEGLTIERYMWSWEEGVWFWAGLLVLFSAQRWRMCSSSTFSSTLQHQFECSFLLVICFLSKVTTPHGQFVFGGYLGVAELERPDPLHCSHWKGCWVSSLHIHPSCQLSVCVEPARPSVYWIPSGMCVRDGQGSTQLSLMPLLPNGFPTDTHRSLAYEADLSLTI